MLITHDGRQEETSRNKRVRRIDREREVGLVRPWFAQCLERKKPEDTQSVAR